MQSVQLKKIRTDMLQCTQLLKFHSFTTCQELTSSLGWLIYYQPGNTTCKNLSCVAW